MKKKDHQFDDFNPAIDEKLDDHCHYVRQDEWI